MEYKSLPYTANVTASPGLNSPVWNYVGLEVAPLSSWENALFMFDLRKAAFEFDGNML